MYKPDNLTVPELPDDSPGSAMDLFPTLYQPEAIRYLMFLCSAQLYTDHAFG